MFFFISIELLLSYMVRSNQLITVSISQLSQSYEFSPPSSYSYIEGNNTIQILLNLFFVFNKKIARLKLSFVLKMKIFFKLSCKHKVTSS